MTFPCVNTIQLGPSPFNSSPQCKKKLFTLSFQPKFLNIWFTKVTATSIKSYVAVNFFVPQSQVVLGACFGPQSPSGPYLEHPKNDQKRTHIGQKWQKEWCYHTFVKEWMKALDKTRILAPSDYFYHFSFPRYGRLKSKFLCERYSHCIFSSCSIDLTKTRYTWSLTAVSRT